MWRALFAISEEGSGNDRHRRNQSNSSLFLFSGSLAWQKAYSLSPALPDYFWALAPRWCSQKSHWLLFPLDSVSAINSKCLQMFKSADQAPSSLAMVLSARQQVFTACPLGAISAPGALCSWLICVKKTVNWLLDVLFWKGSDALVSIARVTRPRVC